MTPRPGANQTTIHQFLDTAAADTFWVQALTAPVPAAATAVKLTDTAPTRHSWNFVAVEIVPAPVSTMVPTS